MNFDDDDILPSTGTLDQAYKARLPRLSQAENRTPKQRLSSTGSHAAFSDRFIPSRSLTSSDSGLRAVSPQTTSGNSEVSPSRSGLFTMLLRSELLGEEIPTHAAVTAAVVSTSPNNTVNREQTAVTPGSPSATLAATNGGTLNSSIVGSATGGALTAPATTPSILRFRRSLSHQGGESAQSTSEAVASPLSPLRSSTSRSLLQSPLVTPGGRSRRKIPKAPFKVLDAPGLVDDFYLNNVDWSSRNIVSVGLGSSVYMWSASTARATLLDNLAGGDNASDEVACTSFTEAGSILAVGTRTGRICLYDVETSQLVRTYESAHTGRVGCATWNGPILATGSRDKRIRERDTRVPNSSDLLRDVAAHRQEVCGLKYSFEGFAGPHRQLASGGNDNKLYVWDARRHDSNPLYRFADHTAAVKAIAWSPHQTGVLASGGGTADRCIKVWSTLTGTLSSSVDTGSQVCGLVFSKTVPELVSTHGYSLNQICVWRAQNPNSMPLQKIATLQGHTLRVLYLALSPDGSTVVTGAGDESLRFWSIWPGRTSSAAGASSKLSDLMLLPGAPGAQLR